ncbi:MAG: FeoB-associated Cys-rich membrane protein [Oscillospiraceae bacterium]|nr:FeoB-associated Cys-rich membrane protein [Oscillospiraceae bacterium]
MNIQSIILLAVLLCAAILALIFTIRNKIISKCSGCTGDCSHCHRNPPSETGR